MKKFFTLLMLVVFCGITAMAQGTVMRVHKTDGSSLLIGLDQIEYVDFPEAFDLSLSSQKWCLHPGQTVHLKLYATEQGTTTEIEAKDWHSSNTSVATVDAAGVVTGKAEGSTVITASYEGQEAEMLVNVVEESAFVFKTSDVTGFSFNFSIEPVNPDTRYYYNVRLMHGDQYSVDSMTDFGSVEENIYNFTKDWFQFMAEQYGGSYTWNSVLQSFLETGKKSDTSTEYYRMLEAGKEYLIYALGFDADGNLSTPVESYLVQTPAPVPSSNTFDVTIDRCLSSDAQFTINPSNNDQYLVCVQRASYVNWYVENEKLNEMAQAMAESFALDSRYPALNKGQSTHYASDFVNPRSDEDYFVIVFGFDNGITTGVTLKRFRTESGWVDPGRDIIRPTAPAEGVTAYPCSLDAVDEYLDLNDQPVSEPIETMSGRIAYSDGKVYLYGFAGAMSDNWLNGTYDAATKTVTFPYPQYVGLFDAYGEGAEPLYVVGGNADTNEMVDLVFDYDEVENKLILQDGIYLVLNQKSFNWAVLMMMKEYTITMTRKIF